MLKSTSRQHSPLLSAVLANNPMQRTIFLLLSVFLITQLFNHAWSTRKLSSRLIKRTDPVENWIEKKACLGSRGLSETNCNDFKTLTLPILQQCDNIWEHEDQCAYVLEHCSDTIPSLINYLQWYYCSGSVKPLVLICLVSYHRDPTTGK